MDFFAYDSVEVPNGPSPVSDLVAISVPDPLISENKRQNIGRAPGIALKLEVTTPARTSLSHILFLLTLSSFVVAGAPAHRDSRYRRSSITH